MAPPENFGAPSEQISLALRDSALSHPHDVQMIYPVHLGPNMPEPVHRILHNVPGVGQAARRIVESVLNVEQR